jgi:hypothetical protein
MTKTERKNMRSAHREYLVQTVAESLLTAIKKEEKGLLEVCEDPKDAAKILTRALNRAREGRVVSRAMARQGFFLGSSISQHLRDRN